MLRHSWRDISRRKCNFCLAFCSIFTVVISTLIINTVVQMGPIVFLKLAENKIGEYDAIFVPNDNTDDNTVFWNYTKVMDTTHSQYNFSPRKVFEYSNLASDTPTKSNPTATTFTGFVSFIDTAKEKKIGIGTEFPFPPQKKGECLVSDSLRVLEGLELN